MSTSNTGKRLNPLDASIIAAALLCLIGFLLARAGLAGVNNVIRGETRVAIDVYFAGLKTLDIGIFKVGERSALTVRNRPVQPPMAITAVKHSQKAVAFLSPDGKSAVALGDPANAYAHDFLVTITGTAEITDDGYVIRGNKIKIGNLIELEGFKYRVQGVVIDVRPAAPAG